MTDKKPRAFISYSRTDQAHCDRIRSYADRLIGDAVDVIFDDYDLKEGQDKYAFMEKMVTDSQVTHVLIFSDRRYADKADTRKAGVGTESQIISREVYEQVVQTKFIPLLCEKGEDGEPCLPTFLKSRIYIDFSSSELANENWERLVRTLYGKPALAKPGLGKPPSYVTEETATALPTRGKFAAFKDAFVVGRPSTALCRRDFLDSAIEFADSLRIRTRPDVEQIDDKVMKDVRVLLPLRDQIVDWLLMETSVATGSEFVDLLAEFLERVLEQKNRPAELTQYQNGWFDAHWFIAYELFLYVIAVLLRNRRYALAHAIFSHNYLTQDRDSTRKFVTFQAFCLQSAALRFRNQRLQLNRLSPEADLLSERATRKDISFRDVIQADAVSFLSAMLSPNFRWFPHTAFYATYGWIPDLFVRSARKKDFEHLKVLFGVSDGDELRKRFDESAARNEIDKWRFEFHADVSLRSMLNIENVDTL